MFACERAGFDVTMVDGDGASLVRHCAHFPHSTVVTGVDYDDGPLEHVFPELSAYDTAVLVVADDTNPERAVALFESGIRGLLYPDAALGSIADAVHAVRAGGVVLHPLFAAVVLGEWKSSRRSARISPGALTPRERDVLIAMTEGLSTKAVARVLRVAPKTVENHKMRIFSKLGVRNQAQAVSVAIRHGLVAGLDPIAPTT